MIHGRFLGKYLNGGGCAAPHHPYRGWDQPTAHPRNPFAQNRYLNVCLHAERKMQLSMRNAFHPIAMWKPFGNDGRAMNFFARGTIRIHNQNAAVLTATNKSSCGRFFLPLSNNPTILF